MNEENSSVSKGILFKGDLQVISYNTDEPEVRQEDQPHVVSLYSQLFYLWSGSMRSTNHGLKTFKCWF